MIDARIFSSKSRFPFSTLALSTTLSFAVAASAWAQDPASDFKLTGFFSLVGGKVLQSDYDNSNQGPSSIAGVNCPCYVADWSNAGVYSKSASLKPESRLGLQLTYKPNTSTSFIGQVVSRGTEGKPDLQWAYGGYKLNSNWEIQVGRKRIPLYYYSDFQDIGVSYPWVTTPPELYGWEVTNYNGASLRYSGNIGDANATASFFTGSETAKDSPYQKLYYTGKSKVTWKNLVGADLEISKDNLTVRAVYMQADVHAQVYDFNVNDIEKLNAFGVAANLDLDDWFILSEFTQLKRDYTNSNYTVTAPAYTIGVGKRIGAWTPFLNYAQYVESSTNHSIYMPQQYKRTSLTLRYDVDSSSAVKAQIDKHRDASNNFGGNATVLRISYDRVF